MADAGESPSDIFPLAAVSDVYPADVDVRLTNHALTAKLYCGLCQMVRSRARARARARETIR